MVVSNAILSGVHRFRSLSVTARFRKTIPSLSAFYHETRPTNLDNEESTMSDMQLYNSLSNVVETLPKENESNKGLAWYTCGPTTYAPAHLGHARTYVCLDIVRRVMEATAETPVATSEAAPPPLFVMNITDVDDKLLAAASELGETRTPLELARHFESEFWDDLDALNCLRPHIVTRVTECVETEIVPYIARLVDQGMAYESTDGVYFNVRAYQEKLGSVTKYGKLAPPAASRDIVITDNRERHVADSTKANASGEKKDPRDFVLWKKKKVQETVAWPSPWGEGRPGWHIECSAMIESIQTRFQDTHRFLVHAGGVDLKFPHHTNEIAQAEAYSETGNWIPHWVHTGHLHIDGLKMSKSLKNFISIQDFFASYGIESERSPMESPSDDFRLWCIGLSGSYRGPATFSEERIAEARLLRARVVRFLTDGEKWINQHRDSTTRSWEDTEQTFFLECSELRKECLKALGNDFDGKKFLENVLVIAEKGTKYMDGARDKPVEPLVSVIDNLRGLLRLVGFTDHTAGAGLKDLDVATQTSSLVVGGERALIEQLVAFRARIRKAALAEVKDGSASNTFVEILNVCDELRDTKLPLLGLELLDSDSDEISWRVGVPNMQPTPSGENENTGSESLDMLSIELVELFKVGPYEGLFSAFTEDGIPTKNADGTDVSKRALKKLLKKRDAHRKRLAQT